MLPPNPHEFRQRDAVYRRGVLLGMTMAEIMILLLFCLLMAFVLRLEEYEQIEEEIARIDQIAEKIEASVGSYTDTWEMLEAIEKLSSSIDLDMLTEIVTSISANDEPNPESVKETLQASLEHINSVREEIIASTGESPSALELQHYVEAQLADAQAWAASQQYDIGEKYTDAVAQNQALTDRVNLLDRALSKAKDQLKGKGQGLEYPSCFETPEGNIQYVYDVEFDEQTVTLHALPVPGNEDLKSRIPFGQITVDNPMQINDYLSETKGVYLWSVQNECRFFVRVFDQTSKENKIDYKIMLRKIESRFYKLEILSSPYSTPPRADTGTKV